MAEMPTGTVTFLFTDIEGSTRLLQALGDRWLGVLEDHHRLMREAIRGAGGVDRGTEGDSFFAVFADAAAAVSAATDAQRTLAAHPWPEDGPVRVRMGLHTGEGTLGGDDYVGLDVHRAARIAAAGHGGQIVISDTTRVLIEPALPDGVSVRGLGAHRLKDLARPERLYDLPIEGLPDAFPPLRTLEPQTNLPPERTELVGRAREVERVKELLRGPGLLTLTGPGGTGKTRLALAAARALLEDYPDGVYFVELAPVSNPELVTSAIASVLGARAEGAGSLAQSLRERVRDREVLVVLDNFEQVLAAAPVVSDLLDAAPHMRVLATSRVPLHLSGEQELPVPPLELPDPDAPAEDLAEAEAVALFARRAAAASPSFAVTGANAAAVAELCRRLDGLPLAIELAASRAKLLSPEEMLRRLEGRLELPGAGAVDLPARQRTLREAIGWSHDLLEEPERAMFRRLSVFAGGWTLEAAEAVANPADELGSDTLELLGSLLDQSLIVRRDTTDGEVRFGMLRTIRDYATERLEDSGEADEVRGRHAQWFRAIAEESEPDLRGMDQARTLRRLEEEHDNLRAALRHVIQAGDADTGMRMVSALWRFWHLHSHLAEGRTWAEQVVALPGAAPRTERRRAALTGLGGIAYWQEDVPVFRAAYEEALEIARELGDPLAEADGLYNLAYLGPFIDDFDYAIERFHQAAEVYERLGHTRGIADTTWILGIAARMGGDVERSRSMAEDALRMHRENGDRFGATLALYALGRVALAQGDLATAESSLLEALESDAAIGNGTGMALILDNLGAQAAARGDHVRAARLAGAADAMSQRAGGRAPPPIVDLPDPREAATAVLGEAAVTAAWEEGRAMPLEQVLDYARSSDSR